MSMRSPVGDGADLDGGTGQPQGGSQIWMRIQPADAFVPEFRSDLGGLTEDRAGEALAVLDVGRPVGFNLDDDVENPVPIEDGELVETR